VSLAGIDLVYTNGTEIEEYTDRLRTLLINDVIEKTYIANLSIDHYKDIIYGYVDVMSSEISSSLSTTENFDDKVNERLNELNFFNRNLYNRQQGLFLTYGGRDFCYDPYYNIQN